VAIYLPLVLLISRIKRHFSGVKGRGVRICEKVPKDVQETPYLVINGKNRKLKIMPCASNNDVSKTVSTSSRELNKEVENVKLQEGRLKVFDFNARQYIIDIDLYRNFTILINHLKLCDIYFHATLDETLLV
jgi:hypothetical protein